jgi:hypothetical protein
MRAVGRFGFTDVLSLWDKESHHQILSIDVKSLVLLVFK